MKNFAPSAFFLLFFAVSKLFGQTVKIVGPDVICYEKSATFCIEPDTNVDSVAWWVSGLEIVGFPLSTSWHQTQPPFCLNLASQGFGNGLIEATVFTINPPSQSTFLSKTVKSKPPIFTSQSRTICKGDSIIVGNQVFKESGFWELDLQNYQGCDSTINLNLTVIDVKAKINLPPLFGCSPLPILLSSGPTSGTKKWTNSGGDLLGMGNSLSVLEAGPVILTVRQTIAPNYECVARDTVLVPPSHPFLKDQLHFSTRNEWPAGAKNGAIWLDSVAISALLPLNFEWSTGQKTSHLAGLGAGDYTLKATDSVGCFHFFSFKIEVEATPIFTGPSRVCPLETAIFCANGLNLTDSVVLFIPDGCSVNGQNGPLALGGIGRVCAAVTFADTLFWLATFGVTIYGSMPNQPSIHLTTMVEVSRRVFTHFQKTICAGETVGLGDSTFSKTGYFEVVLPSAGGCDSVLALQLFVVPLESLPMVSDSLNCQNPFVELTDGFAQGGILRKWFSPSGQLLGEKPTLEATESGHFSLVSTRKWTLGGPLECHDTAMVEVIRTDSLPFSVTAKSGAVCSNSSAQLAVLTDAPNASFAWFGPFGNLVSTSQSPVFQQIGTYRVEVSSGDCTVAALADLRAGSAFYVSDDEVFCDTATGLQSILIYVSGGLAPFSFEWSDGQTTQYADSLAAGIYRVTATDAQGCRTTFERQLLPTFCNIVGADEVLFEEDKIGISPNPTDGSVSLFLPKNWTEKRLELELFAADGRLIERLFFTKKDAETIGFDLKSQPNGLFYLKIRRDDGRVVFKKLVKI